MTTMEKWRRCQELEESYISEGKYLQWGTDLSEQYWIDKLLLDSTDGKILELGCGPFGLFKFKENVVGLDSIDYSVNAKGELFVHGMMEDLSQFDDDSFEVVLCCNSLDHGFDPELAVKEMFRVAPKIVFWSNVFPPITKYLMDVFDAQHPYHFTMDDIKKLFSINDTPYSNKVSKKYSEKLFNIYYPIAKTAMAKVKLIGSYVFGAKGLCIHIERYNASEGSY